MRRYSTLSIAIVAALALSRGGPSPWLLRLEVAGFMAAALAFGFSTCSPRLGWLRHQEIRVLACFLAGAAALFIDPRFVISSVFIGLAIRTIMTSPSMAPKPTASDIVLRDRADIVIR